MANDLALATNIVPQAMAALRKVSPDSRIATHNTNALVHGSLVPDGDVEARIASFVTRRPEAGPPFVPSGVSFLCDLPDGQGRGSIILENSAVIPGGALVRVTSDLAGSLSESEALNQAIEFFQASTESLGLDVEWTV